MDYNCTLRHRMFQMPAAFPRSHTYCGAFILFNKLPFSINGSELKGHSSKDLINHKLLHRQSLYAWLFYETTQELSYPLPYTPKKTKKKQRKNWTKIQLDIVFFFFKLCLCYVIYIPTCISPSIFIILFLSFVVSPFPIPLDKSSARSFTFLPLLGGSVGRISSSKR